MHMNSKSEKRSVARKHTHTQRDIMFKAIWLRQQDTEAAPVFSLKDRLSVYKIISLCVPVLYMQFMYNGLVCF